MIQGFYGNSFGLTPLATIGLGIIALIIAIIVITLKGYSLWYAAKRDEKWWFIILLIVNTIGILELIYLIFVVKKWSKSPNPSVGSSSTPVNPIN